MSAEGRRKIDPIVTSDQKSLIRCKNFSNRWKRAFQRTAVRVYNKLSSIYFRFVFAVMYIIQKVGEIESPGGL